MKFVQWRRFNWELARLPDLFRIEAQYRIRPATREDEQTVRLLIHRAFSLDPDWAQTRTRVVAMIDGHLEEIFRQREVPCLVVTHGSRIIGASALTLRDDAENHLLSGPCILAEYRRRGIGSALLHQSLAMLRDAGLEHAHGVTKEGVPAAKFVYSQFDSVSEQYDFESLPVC